MTKRALFRDFLALWGHPRVGLLSTMVLTITALANTARAGSATWNVNPASNDWSTSINWTPQTVPDEEADVATFEQSNVTNITIATIFSLGGIVFSSGASAYRFTISQGVGYISFQGAGVINNSGVTQNFDCVGNVGFAGSATAGNDVIYTDTNVMFGPWVTFSDTSDAGTATFINKGNSAGIERAFLDFTGQSSAANSIIVNEEGDTDGGETSFDDNSTAGNSVITVNSGAVVLFDDNSTGDTATLIADGGEIFFRASSNGELARVELANGGLLDLGTHNNAVPMTIGSLEGDGTSSVSLGRQQLSIGGNGLDTTFSGSISGGGSLLKVGNERLILTGSNTYRGGTTVSGGTLIAQARTGSATGSGVVRINAGTLAGKGSISGAPTIGTGTGTGAYLSPGTKGPDTLIFTKILTFKADGSYKCDLSLGQTKADQVKSNGVTIQSGAQFVLQPKGFQALTIGTVFIVLTNTAATPISGTFANLADGAIITATAGNRLQASYTGGDGNDLTLTVVP